MSKCVSAQFWFIIETNKNSHSQTGSNIFVTGHMTVSGATTFK